MISILLLSEFKAGNVLKILCVIFYFAVFSACAGNTGKEEKIHIAIENQPGNGEKLPITATISFNGKKAAENQKIEAGIPFSIIKTLPRGKNSINISEDSTGAVYNSAISLEGEKWLKIVFYRESKSMGYFEGKLQDRPFGYEAEKTDEKNKEAIKDRKTSEEEIDKKIDNIGKDIKKSAPVKKNIKK
jgi:hypothetical protein